MKIERHSGGFAALRAARLLATLLLALTSTAEAQQTGSVSVGTIPPAQGGASPPVPRDRRPTYAHDDDLWDEGDDH